jgi:hypothetical protein
MELTIEQALQKGIEAHKAGQLAEMESFVGSPHPACRPPSP